MFSLNNTNQLQGARETSEDDKVLTSAAPGTAPPQPRAPSAQGQLLGLPAQCPDPAGSWQVRGIGQSCQAHGDAVCSCPTGTGRQPHANRVEAATGGFPSLEHVAEPRLHLPQVLPDFPSARLCLVGDAAWLLQHVADHSDTQILITDFDSRLVNLTAAALPVPSCKRSSLCSQQAQCCFTAQPSRAAFCFSYSPVSVTTQRVLPHRSTNSSGAAARPAELPAQRTAVPCCNGSAANKITMKLRGLHFLAGSRAGLCPQFN